MRESVAVQSNERFGRSQQQRDGDTLDAGHLNFNVPTIARMVPVKDERWNSSSATNDEKARLRQTEQPNPESVRGCPG